MIYGYARVSTKGQALYGNSLESQEEQLRAAGAEKIYAEAYTGTKANRPELERLLAELKSGDTVVVTKLDRVARNTRDGIDIIDKITEMGCKLHILNMGLFDNTPTGRLMKNVMLAFAEFERAMITERMQGGRAYKRETDPEYKDGRKKVEIDTEKAQALLGKGLSVRAMCKELGISRATWYNRA